MLDVENKKLKLGAQECTGNISSLTGKNYNLSSNFHGLAPALTYDYGASFCDLKQMHGHHVVTAISAFVTRQGLG